MVAKGEDPPAHRALVAHLPAEQIIASSEAIWSLLQAWLPFSQARLALPRLAITDLSVAATTAEALHL